MEDSIIVKVLLENLGRIAYNSYGDNRLWQTYDKGSMPSWEKQSPELKTAWIAAVRAVMDATIEVNGKT